LIFDKVIAKEEKNQNWYKSTFTGSKMVAGAGFELIILISRKSAGLALWMSVGISVDGY
jgi:hypothetical protein